jgi:hypothetical protein
LLPAVVLAIPALLWACSGAGQAASSDSPPVTLSEADRSLVGRWTDSAGRELPDGTNASGGLLVLQTNAGSTTCSAGHATVFLRISWPVGTQLDWRDGAWTDADAPEFVRDTTGSAIETYGHSDLDIDLPRSAQPTGFQRQGNTLSVDSPRVAIFVTRPDGRTERWARVKGGGCG